MAETPASDFTVTLDERDPRAADWQAAFGTLTVPIQSWLPELCDLPEIGPQLCYLLDLAALAADQRTRLEQHLATRFAVPLAEVQTTLATQGTVPLLAEGCTVTILHPHKWL